MRSFAKSQLENMIILLVICLLFHVNILNAKPAKQSSISYYDAIVNKCPPYFTSDLSSEAYKNQDIFKKCQSWQEISETKELTKETEQNVFCLLYYESFSSYCNLLKTSPGPEKLVPDVTGYKASEVCQNMSLFGNVSKIINDHLCYKICMEYTEGVVQECGLAYYFANNVADMQTKMAAAKPQEPNQGSSSVGLAIQPPSAASSTALKADNQLPQQNSVKNISTSSKVDEKQPMVVNLKTAVNPEGESKNSQPNKTVITAPKISEGAQNKQQAGEVPDETHHKTADQAKLTTNNKANDVKEERGEPQPPGVANEQQKQSTGNENVITSKITNNDQTANGAQQPSSTTDHKEQSANNVENNDQSKSNQLPNPTSDKLSPGEQPKQKADDNPGVENEQEETVYEKNDPPPANEENTNEYADEEEEGKQNEQKVNEIEVVPEKEKEKEKPTLTRPEEELPANYNTVEDLDGESSFFSYFMIICVLFVLGYVGYHNRQKIVALMLEGKRGKRHVRGRRPNSANYHKLDSNLEEAISSTCTKNASHVIY